MQIEQVMAELEALGTEQNRKTYRRHGASENLFGVSFADQGKLKKRIKTDHSLAQGLWSTGNDDARALATMVADPKAFISDELESWAADVEALRSYGMADLLASAVASSPLAREKAEAWTVSDQEYVGQMGWNILAILALRDASLTDAYFEPYLDQIESGIHERKNRVRYSMNSALIAIGSRNEALRLRAEAVATSIGKVQVDHGDTGCKTPDACSYIGKTWARKEAKLAAKA